MGEISLIQALDEFKNTFLPARNLATRTREEYANDLKYFISFVEKAGVTKTGGLSTYHIDRYLAKLDELGYSGSTRKRKAITFRTFLFFLYRNGYISHDISSQVILPFPEHSSPRILAKTEYQKLLAVSKSNPRDFAIIALALQTGIKLSELIRLSLASVHLPEDIDVESGPRRKTRTIPLNSKAYEALQAYLETRPASEYPNLFLNRLGEPLGERGVQKVIKHYLHLAGIAGASVHSLRHTFAVQHIIRGTSLKTLQRILGHKDIRTTEEYISLVNGVVRKMFEENAL